MPNKRIIARLDIKPPNLIKGINLEGVRVVGNPQEYARRYYQEGADELLYMDAVATLYNRNSLGDLVRHTAENVFIPLTVGGGIRSVEDADSLLRAGADKVAINTATINNPELISQIANRFGSQCMVLSIEAKKVGNGKWEAYTDNGREKTGKDVKEWAEKAAKLGAGEILLTSVDHEGLCEGFDTELTKTVSISVDIPVIASGGMGELAHIKNIVEKGCADAIAMAHVLHFNKFSLTEIKKTANEFNIPVRQI